MQRTIAKETVSSFTRCAVSRIIAKLCFGVLWLGSGAIPALLQPLHPAV